MFLYKTLAKKNGGKFFGFLKNGGMSFWLAS
jgi:hypothetical protein